jgi:hypothetical protein
MVISQGGGILIMGIFRLKKIYDKNTFAIFQIYYVASCSTISRRRDGKSDS